MFRSALFIVKVNSQNY